MPRFENVNHSGRAQESIHIGGLYASRRPTIIRTTLGSCIALCLYDPVSHIGGMNHFMLPDQVGPDPNPTRYGVYAVETLLERCVNLGADRRNLEAKAFGGGHVLRIKEMQGNVAQANVDFIKDFLSLKGLRLVAEDLGGLEAREIFFFTDTGRTMLRRFHQRLEDSIPLARPAGKLRTTIFFSRDQTPPANP